MVPDHRAKANAALALSLLANTLSFVTWRLLAPLAPGFQTEYGLTNTQISMVIAAPVLLGSLGRIPAVFWDKSVDRVLCPCHDDHFDARSGNLLYGPPRRPLPVIDLEVRDGVVYALGAGPRKVKTDGA